MFESTVERLDASLFGVSSLTTSGEVGDVVDVVCCSVSPIWSLVLMMCLDADVSGSFSSGAKREV
jgi:hypothetical protein